MKLDRQTRLYLSIFIFLIIAYIFVNAHAIQIQGKAFYFTHEGFKMSEPGEPLPPEISNLNMVLWGGISILLVSLLIVIEVMERRKPKKKARRRR